MTMRTYRYFHCPNGHRGTEKTLENDQPYSNPWESVSTTGLIDMGNDKDGFGIYVCNVCGSEMIITTQADK